MVEKSLFLSERLLNSILASSDLNPKYTLLSITLIFFIELLHPELSILTSIFAFSPILNESFASLTVNEHYPSFEVSMPLTGSLMVC